MACTELVVRIPHHGELVESVEGPSLESRQENMLSPKEKSKVLDKVRIHEKDTGSAEAQVALFSEEIEHLTKHLKKHKKDNSSRLGLLKMVAKRKRFLDHLKREYPKRYTSLVKKLGLD